MNTTIPRICFIFMLIWPMLLQAQLSRGTFYSSSYGINNIPGFANGLAELSLTTGNGDGLLRLAIAPEFGLFVSDRWLLGSRLTIGSFILSGETGAGSFSFSPFARYYFNPQARNNHFFANAQLDLSLSPGAVGANLGLGLTHFLAPGLGWDTYLALQRSNFEIEQNLRMGLFSQLNIYLNKDQRSNRREALSGIQRGSIMIGGTNGGFSFGLQSAREGTSNVSAFDVAPNLLYFFTDQLAVGTRLNLIINGNDYFNATTFGLAPQVRYYFAKAQHQLWFIGSAYEFARSTGKVAEQNFEVNTSSLSFGGGLNSFLTSHLALELAPNLNYNFERNTTRLGIDLGVQFFLHPR
ncbi:MAG: hypothetical protein SFV55_12115 [Haliscomenobacter sp.]|uniref:hypothetical protein n=1 Tax=Haliscomenobacter sp. TaxID=2717303 RepID=UPI0029A48B4C|nr:hypothetical protein [Haliscomenobacter sp.]MDX2069159.1 hypothetical protein [Haliscomenobacter sp.]